MVKQHTDLRRQIVERRVKIYNKTLHPLFATDAVQKKIGMGTSAFFHCSSRFFQRHQKSRHTGRLRIEESTYLGSVEEETAFLESSEDDLLRQVVNILETKGQAHIRHVPFDHVWKHFWSSVNKHFFVIEERKIAVVYFYNAETCQFIGPLYDSGPRFKTKDCCKRYSIEGKQAIVSDHGRIGELMKTNNVHQFPIPPLNVGHHTNRHNFSQLKGWAYDIDIAGVTFTLTWQSNEIAPIPEGKPQRPNKESARADSKPTDQPSPEKEDTFVKRDYKEGYDFFEVKKGSKVMKRLIQCMKCKWQGNFQDFKRWHARKH